MSFTYVFIHWMCGGGKKESEGNIGKEKSGGWGSLGRGYSKCNNSEKGTYLSYSRQEKSNFTIWEWMGRIVEDKCKKIKINIYRFS